MSLLGQSRLHISLQKLISSVETVETSFTEPPSKLAYTVVHVIRLDLRHGLALTRLTNKSSKASDPSCPSQAPAIL
jgi:hypothetical protein